MDGAKVGVWDLFVRSSHWLLVALFTVSYLSGENEHPVHVWSGYTILTLIALRLIWGVAGTWYARFSAFQWSPTAVLAYLRSLILGGANRSLGHNPAGSWMVLLLLVAVLATCGCGLMLYGIEGHEPMVGFVSSSGEEAEKHWKGLHEFFINVTLSLIAVHVVGVIASSLRHKENLVREMVTGHKRPLK